MLDRFATNRTSHRGAGGHKRFRGYRERVPFLSQQTPGVSPIYSAVRPVRVVKQRDAATVAVSVNRLPAGVLAADSGPIC